MKRRLGMQNQTPDLFGGGLPVVTLAATKWPANYIDQFWQAYPIRVGKAKAIKSLEKAREAGVPFQTIMDGVKRYTAWLGERDSANWRPEPKHPATWLNGGCWDDDLPRRSSGTSNSFFQRAMR